MDTLQCSLKYLEIGSFWCLSMMKNPESCKNLGEFHHDLTVLPDWEPLVNFWEIRFYDINSGEWIIVSYPDMFNSPYEHPTVEFDDFSFPFVSTKACWLPKWAAWIHHFWLVHAGWWSEWNKWPAFGSYESLPIWKNRLRKLGLASGNCGNGESLMTGGFHRKIIDKWFSFQQAMFDYRRVIWILGFYLRDICGNLGGLEREHHGKLSRNPMFGWCFQDKFVPFFLNICFAI